MSFFFFDYKPYVAIIGDIVASKQLVDRQTVQKQLRTTLNAINEMYRNDIASKFMITLGDEFQGLLQIGNHAFEIVETIERAMRPTEIRFGLGVGKITTPINFDIPLGADGPAYYNARKMIDELKSMKKKKKEPRITMKIDIEDNADVSELINAVFSLTTVLKAKWTDRQREIIDVYLKCSGTQSDVANHLGIHQSNVQKALSNADFYTYQNVLTTVTNILSKIQETKDD
ncbi:SatD family protein [Sporolactobacillus shoreicorticis]|uniref:SatD family protein n=1 Tax=Sporolactobacillus shoreicorticis TaxID=1923877 RepID=A0ABW5S0P5_9BACL|nr:SatD family protein [Sporolactobacillus shoreicorticis]MCO7124498.1 SatD family protein [Sporolactobacillus shoreicorticis]